MKKNYKMIISYDGTRYYGWEHQPDRETIQGKLEKVLFRMCDEKVPIAELKLNGAGRTDAGVHAAGQVANFHMDEHFSVEEICDNLNEFLPEDIAVTEIAEVDDRFHSRYNAVSKTYSYRIRTSPVADVFERRFVYHYGKPLDVGRMKAAAERLKGTHDFASFCGNKKMKKSTVRTIMDITFAEKDGEIEIR